MLGLGMYKLRFLVGLYARGLWRPIAVLLGLGGTVTLGAALTPFAAPVALTYALVAGALAALAVTSGVMVLNAALAAALGRGIARFEAAYDAWRRANAIPDLFYEEMDREEAAARAEASVSPGTAAPAARTTI